MLSAKLADTDKIHCLFKCFLPTESNNIRYLPLVSNKSKPDVPMRHYITNKLLIINTLQTSY